MRSCNQSGTTHSVFIRSRMVSRTALKLFSFGFLLMMTLKVSYTSCQINRWHKNCYKVFHRNHDIWTNGVWLGCIKEGDTERRFYTCVSMHIFVHMYLVTIHVTGHILLVLVGIQPDSERPGVSIKIGLWFWS